VDKTSYVFRDSPHSSVVTGHFILDRIDDFIYVQSLGRFSVIQGLQSQKLFMISEMHQCFQKTLTLNSDISHGSHVGALVYSGKMFVPYFTTLDRKCLQSCYQIVPVELKHQNLRTTTFYPQTVDCPFLTHLAQ